MLLMGQGREGQLLNSRLIHTIGQVITGEGEWILAMLLSSLVIPKKYVYPKRLSFWPGRISVMDNDQTILRTSVFFNHWLSRQLFYHWFSLVF